MISIVVRIAATSLVALSAAFAASTVTAQSSTGQSCGPPAWSIADQRHVTVPCTAPTPKAEPGKAACGVPTWSIADQRHTVLPCTDPSTPSERAAHIGE